MTRFLASLLVLVSSALAQGDPGFPKSGKHFDHLATLRPNVTIKEVLADEGVFVFRFSDAKGDLNLAVTDTNGKQLVPGRFSKVESLGQGYISARGKAAAGSPYTRGWTLLHVPTRRTWQSPGEFAVLESGEIVVREPGKAYVCRAEGKQLKRVSADYSSVEPHGRGTFWAEGGKDDLWGIVGVDGAVRVPLRYQDKGSVSEGYLVLKLGQTEAARMNPKHKLRRGNRIGVITSAGKQVLPFYYNRVDAPIGGVCAWSVGKTSKSERTAGISDLRTGKVLLEVTDQPLLYSHRIENVDGKSFLLIRSHKNHGQYAGAYATKKTYRPYHRDLGFRTKDWHHKIEVHPTEKGPVYALQKAAKGPWELRDAQFRVLEANVKKVEPVTDMLLVTPAAAGGKKHFVRGDGRVPVDASVVIGFPKRGQSYHGRIPVRVNGLMGFVDTAGRPVVAAKYESLNYFTPEGLAPVKTKTGWGVIDENGMAIVEPKFLTAQCFWNQPYFMLMTPDGISLRYRTGEEFFTAPKRFRMNMLTRDRLAVTEYVDKKIVRWFLFALK